MILKRLKIDTWIGDPTNCYIVFDQNSKEIMVIDPAGDVKSICEMIDILKGNVKYIYLTHCHGDHIGGVNELKARKGGKILIGRFDADGLNDRKINLTEFMEGFPEIELEPDSRVDDNDSIHLGSLEFKVIHTPGHTIGGTSLYIKEQNLVFSGDTLFFGAWGRTDLPTSDFKELMQSITKKLMILPEDTMVYPGHRKANNDRK